MNFRPRGAVVTSAVLIMTLGGCTGGDNAPAGGKKGMVPAVAVASVRRGPIIQTLQLTGTVEPVRTAWLASPVEGPVRTLWVREGDTVKGATVLLDIGRKGAVNAQLAAARENLRSRELDFERIKKLVAEGAVAESQLDAARTQYENARAQHARASEASGDFRIRAPWRGIVSEVLVEEGDFVVPRAQLLHMYDPVGLIVISSVPETRAHRIRDRAPVEVRFDAYPGRTCRGTVSRVYPRLDPKTRTRTFEVTVDDTVALIPGMFARLAIEIARADSALVVPKDAVVTNPKGKEVVYIVENKSASAQPVVIGMQAGELTEITSGVRAGDIVVVAGNEKLKDGAPVRIAGKKGGGGGQDSAAKQPGNKKGAAASGRSNDGMKNEGQREGDQ
jgi:membrane fusion protein, multidrug efflux system